MEGIDRYTPLRLYKRRRSEHVKEQWNNLKLVVDWTVWLYLLVPGLLYFGGWYWSMWTKPLPSWAESLPLPLMAMGLEVVMLTGGVLLFMEEADMLFLKSRRTWMKTLIRRGLCRSGVLHMIKIAVLFLMTAPLWSRAYVMPMGHIILLALWTGIAAFVQALSLHLILVKYESWRRWIRVLPLGAAMGFVYVTATLRMHDRMWAILLGILGAMAVLTMLCRIRLELKNTFEGDVREDLRRRMKLAGVLLSQAVTAPKATRTKTFIFRKPRKLLRSRSLSSRTAETAFKAYFRNTANTRLYVQLASLSVAAVAIPPFPANVIVCGLLIMMLTVLFHRSWNMFETSDYIQLLSYDPYVLNRAGDIMVRMLFIPVGLLVGYALGAAWLGWWQGLLTAAAAIGFGFLTLEVGGWVRRTRS
ncbi:ABC transporter permease [Paenibacillus sp. FSL W8-0426]|uniref:ABC transporter permease n=1 Tax=Paenibacillus sp. FSL W8-0426 TaxID=2921714 RepID=UPI0030DD765D